MHETCWGATQRRRAHYRHETPLPLAFHMMVMADAFVMSRSSLSMAAALLSNGTVAFLSAERRLLGPRSSATAELAACRLQVGSSPASGQLPSKWAAPQQVGSSRALYYMQHAHRHMHMPFGS